MATLENTDRRTATRLPQRVLQIDGSLTSVLGVGLMLGAGLVAGWLGVGNTVVLAAGGAIVLFGLGLLALARPTVRRPLIVGQAILNLAFAVACGVALIEGWNVLASEGRWLVGLVSDASLILGAAELYAARAMR